MPIPAMQAATDAVNAKLGKLVGKYLGLGRPPGVRGLQPVHGVGAAEFARLHDESTETRDQR